MRRRDITAQKELKKVRNNEEERKKELERTLGHETAEEGSRMVE